MDSSDTATGPARSAPVAVLGSGSWGTALAIQYARAGRETRLWGRDPEQIARLAADRVNARYLPGATFPAALKPEADLAHALAGATDILVVVPSHAFRPLLDRIKPHLTPGQRVVWATKGFERNTLLLPHQVAREVLGDRVPTAVLSGPTFAREVGLGLPTAITVASTDSAFADDLARVLSNEYFRAYTSDDIIGVEVGGAVKNVIAVATGIADGLGFGANTRAALITRGLAEMTRLGLALGARPGTFMGLAALGDLVLTCTDNQSRNRRFGLALAEGLGADEALARIGQVVEGYEAARAVLAVSKRHGVDMPIANAVEQVLFEGVLATDAARTLMERELRAEH